MSKNKKVFKNSDVSVEPGVITIFKEEGWGEELTFDRKDWDCKVVLTRKVKVPKDSFEPGYYFYVLKDHSVEKYPTLIWHDRPPSITKETSIDLDGYYERWTGTV